ncbi:MAG: T9SS type A sorting domain-containing protein, partial [Cytophagales bacterium]|nr:T9SS type A sorting domain-containing protein [Cytophagales bacterium]
ELESKTPPIPVTPPITSLEDPLDDGIFLYPVPSSHSLTLASEFQLNEGKVHIYNANGHRVTSYDITGDTKELKLDISNLLPGLYFLTLHINDQNRRYKIIKK